MADKLCKYGHKSEEQFVVPYGCSHCHDGQWLDSLFFLPSAIISGKQIDVYKSVLIVRWSSNAIVAAWHIFSKKQTIILFKMLDDHTTFDGLD